LQTAEQKGGNDETEQIVHTLFDDDKIHA
jgi:hypothetical protein